MSALLDYSAGYLAEQQRRFRNLLPRRLGEHPAAFEKAEARLEAAECAVALAQAAPSNELAKEAHRAVDEARWAVDDIASARFRVEAEERVLVRAARRQGTRLLPLAAE